MKQVTQVFLEGESPTLRAVKSRRKNMGAYVCWK